MNWEADVVLYSVYHTLLRLCCYMTHCSWVACSTRYETRRITLLYAICGSCRCHCLGRSSLGEGWVNKLPSSQRFSEFRFVFNHQIVHGYVSRMKRLVIQSSTAFRSKGEASSMHTCTVWWHGDPIGRRDHSLMQQGRLEPATLIFFPFTYFCFP